MRAKHGYQGRVKDWQHGPSMFCIYRTLIQQRLLVEFSCEFPTIYPPLRDLLLVTLLVFVTSGCHNKCLHTVMLFLLPLSISLSNYNIDICLVNILKLYSSISINLTLCHMPSLPVWKIYPHSDTASQHLIYKPTFYSGHPPHNMLSWQ